MEKLLEVKNLNKQYPIKAGLLKKVIGHVHAVDDVNFSVLRGETFGLVGESGCGKTTVGKLVSRLITPDAGEILFEGTDLAKLSNREMLPFRKDIQFIFQDPYSSLNPRMNVFDLLAEPMRIQKMGTPESIRTQIEELIETVGLNTNDLKKYPHEFSGGQRQRIAIARALSVRPKLVVCDEPISALDVSIQAQILNTFKKLQMKTNVSFIFIAHGMASVKHISQRIGVMYLGSLVEISDSGTIVRHGLHPYTRALMSAVPNPNPKKRSKRILLQGEVPSPINPPSGCKFSTRCPYVTEECLQSAPALREYNPHHWIACHNIENIEKAKQSKKTATSEPISTRSGGTFSEQPK